MSLSKNLVSLNASISFCSSSLKRPMGLFPKQNFSRSASFTPVISGGFWKLTTIPSFARSSTLLSVMSMPMKTILPETTSYPGSPIKALSSVVFPDPFGPKRMWLSWLFRLKLISFRISLPSTLTDKFSTSRMFITINIAMFSTEK